MKLSDLVARAATINKRLTPRGGDAAKTYGLAAATALREAGFPHRQSWRVTRGLRVDIAGVSPADADKLIAIVVKAMAMRQCQLELALR